MSTRIHIMLKNACCLQCRFSYPHVNNAADLRAAAGVLKFMHVAKKLSWQTIVTLEILFLSHNCSNLAISRPSERARRHHIEFRGLQPKNRKQALKSAMNAISFTKTVLALIQGTDLGGCKCRSSIVAATKHT